VAQMKNCDAGGGVKTRQSDSTEERDFYFRRGMIGDMPDRDVKTIQDLIYYQYAKIIAKRLDPR